MINRVIRSLFAKVFLVAIACMIVPMLVSMFFVNKYSASVIEKGVTDSLKSNAVEKKNQVELAFKGLADVAKTNASDAFIIDFLKEFNVTQQVDALKAKRIADNLSEKLKKSNGLYENIFISYNGSIFIDGIDGKSVGHKNSDEPWFNPIMSDSNHNVYIADPVASPISGLPDMVVACPVVDDVSGRVLAIFTLPVELNTLTKSIVSENSEMKMNTLILSSSGLVASSNDPEKILKLDFSKEQGDYKEFYNQLKKSDTGIGYFTLDGAKCIAAYVKSDKLNMYIVTYMPISEYISELYKLRGIAIIILIVSILIAGFVIFSLAFRLTKPLGILEMAAHRIASGDLSVSEIKVTTQDELGRLAKAFESMVGNLQSLTRQISGSSEQIAASSEQLTASAEQSAQAANQVATSISDTAHGVNQQVNAVTKALTLVEEITTEAQEEAAKTRDVVDIAKRAVSAADEGNKSVNTAISQMTNIRQTVDTSAQVIAELGERSKEIGQIVETISGIASQTNLLALNAAIEAARAGEQGRGFAVVAEEVRRLAEQSQEAAKKITGLITNIQEKTNEAVSAMANGTQEVRRGAEVVNQAGKAFGDINGHVQQVAEIAQGAADGLNQLEATSRNVLEQIRETEQISRDIATQSQTIAAATEEQSASMEEIASSSQHLANLAEKLQSAVAKFKF
ncbi:MAG: mcpB 2 [Firmicutes bacterium]|nr:mcpB 2 [Bacillota bacterium]